MGRTCWPLQEKQDDTQNVAEHERHDVAEEVVFGIQEGVVHVPDATPDENVARDHHELTEEDVDDEQEAAVALEGTTLI